MRRNLQLLTGTPINKPTDMYAYIKLTNPDVYRSYGHFENMHVEERDFFKKPIKFCNLEFARDALAVRTISRTKKEMHGYSLIPIYPDCEYELSSEHYKIYTRLVDEQLLVYDDGTKIDATTIHKLRHALQQVVVNFDHFANDPSKRSAAYDLIDLTIAQTECALVSKSKLIIWTKYTRTTSRVLAYCKSLGINTVAAYGGADSASSIDSFMKDESVRILVANMQSAGAGLNPQYVCSEALFLELDPVPLYVRQAVGRLDRMGQTVAPTMRFAIARGTVQVPMYDDLLKKDDMVTFLEPSKKGLRDMLLGARNQPALAD